MRRLVGTAHQDVPGASELCVHVGAGRDSGRAQAGDEALLKELRKYRNFCKDKLASRLDNLQSRVRSLAEDERYFKRLVELDAEFAGLDAVTADGLQQLASNWITPYRLSLAVLGDLKGVNVRPNALHW